LGPKRCSRTAWGSSFAARRPHHGEIKKSGGFSLGATRQNVARVTWLHACDRYPKDATVLRDLRPREGIMHRTVALVTVTTSLAFIGSALAQEKISIVSSTYSSDDLHTKDCTAAVKSKCEDQTSCTFVSDDSVCGSPDSGSSPKILITEFKCGLLSLQNHTRQKETVTLACY
jgi:hypothetical protein